MEDNSNELIEADNSDINELDEILASLFGLAQSAYEAVENSAFFNTVMDYAEIVDDTCEKISKLYKGIKAVASIPDKLFLRKFERLCLGVGKIPEKKRKKYIQKISKKKFNKESAFILDVISRVEDLNKIDVFSLLWEAKIDEKIDDDKFRRYVIMTANTMLQDLIYMSRHIINDTFYITKMEEEGLLAQGWIIYSGLAWATEEGSGGNVYEYTSAAKEYCEIIWNKVPSDKEINRENIFTAEPISDDEIKSMFSE
ncbi:hypothetical protein [Lachnospira hominis (ex Liu et al. 2021)]|uniref:DUF4240 domain-containing protein n=1 Tax=Lachnospira hominis (ex Liu et al. 2021) TaxID=2763051 RepID=A0ABR7G2W2_9FIRM|nr:hypothetical protein [Lachnospira hominis]MBC5681777.1 hypothetical protein [Lachnospira hominis]